MTLNYYRAKERQNHTKLIQIKIYNIKLCKQSNKVPEQNLHKKQNPHTQKAAAHC